MLRPAHGLGGAETRTRTHARARTHTQIRRGDACGQTRPCLDIHLYAEATLRVCKQYGIRLVYLASDDPHATAEVCVPLFQPTPSRDGVCAQAAKSGCCARAGAVARHVQAPVRTCCRCRHVRVRACTVQLVLV